MTKPYALNFYKYQVSNSFLARKLLLNYLGYPCLKYSWISHDTNAGDINNMIGCLRWIHYHTFLFNENIHMFNDIITGKKILVLKLFYNNPISRPTEYICYNEFNVFVYDTIEKQMTKLEFTNLQIKELRNHVLFKTDTVGIIDCIFMTGINDDFKKEIFKLLNNNYSLSYEQMSNAIDNEYLANPTDDINMLTRHVMINDEKHLSLCCSYTHNIKSILDILIENLNNFIENNEDYTEGIKKSIEHIKSDGYGEANPDWDHNYKIDIKFIQV